MNMQRREFITILGGAAAAWPLAARAQQPAMPVVGFLGAGAAGMTRENVAATLRGLSETGYVEGRNLAVEYRWAEDRMDRLPTLADDLVRNRVAAIVSPGTSVALALKAATQTIPIVFVVGADPVEAGLVASLNRPGGNLTGFALLSLTVSAKRLELLHEFVPAATLIACLVNPTSPAFTNTETNDLLAAARILGLRLLLINASHESEIEAAFSILVRERVGALLVSAEAFFVRSSFQIVALAARHAVPTIYPFRQHVMVGGLMSYGTDLPEAHREAGIYAGRILKGEKAADLPVQQVTKMQLAINMKAAKTLGITFPTALLVRADEVIE